MSRHILIPRPDLPMPVDASCGWDGPMQTFFLQVLAVAPGLEDPAVLVWMGGGWREHLEPEPLIEAAARWAEIPPRLAETLIAERDADRRDVRPSLLAALAALRNRSP